MQAVILAGGMGTRLRPLTNILPKPLMPIGNTSILEIILRQLKNAGVNEVILSCGYLSHLIRAFFEDGKKFGLKINYSVEEQSLGTAGPLSLIMNDLDENFLVMNGDILTNLDYKKMYDFHKSEKASATVSIKNREVKIDFGVIKKNKIQFLEYDEKPIYKFDVSMGINILNKKSIQELLIKDVYMDIPDLITKIHKKKLKVLCYSQKCEWLDIGRFEDYEMAVKKFDKDKNLYLKD